MLQNKLLFYLVAFISTIALISFSLSPFFEVRNFEYHGIDIITVDELSIIMEPYKNANILLLDHREVTRLLLRNSYIKSVDIKKHYPDKISINIKEREAIAKINNDGQFLIFTSSGFILDTGSMKSRVSVPEIKGLGYSLNNNYINFSPILNDIVQALEELDISVRSGFNTVFYKEEDTITAKFKNIPIYLGLPSKLIDKFRILQSIITKITQEDLDVEYIDLTLYKKPVIKLNK